jgi:hypothetical protein
MDAATHPAHARPLASFLPAEAMARIGTVRGGRLAATERRGIR